MQIPILNGVYTDGVADFRTSYPVNMVPVPKDQGISNGYLRPADGLVHFADGPGIDRGGINWNGSCYRVMGTKLVRVNVDGTITVLGDVGSGGQVTMDYSFDRLAVSSGGRLYYWNGSLTQVTDADLGTVLDFCWVDGYFLTTDGSFLIVTELNDPLQVSQLKYGSSEVDPDPIKAVVKLRNEVYAINRHTIEVFDNVGGELFPFQRIEGAQIQKGSVGTHTKCVFFDSVAFIGGGRNEAPSIYIGANAGTVKIASREVDQILLGYSESELSLARLEPRVDKSHNYLFAHLPDRTLVYDAAASQIAGEPVWFVLTSAVDGFSQYKAGNFVWCYNKWLCGDPTSPRVAEVSDSVSTHYGQDVRWEFGTMIVYNEGRGAIFHQLELVCLTGRVAPGSNPSVSTSYSTDGETWSQDRFVRVGGIGDRGRRVVWLQQGNMRNWRIQRFRGTSQAHISVARLEAQIEPLVF